VPIPFVYGGVAVASAAAGWLLGRGAHAVHETLKAYGSLSDEVVVTVSGNIYAEKRRLYLLAAATAFGVARVWVLRLGGVVPPPGVIMMETDYANNAVRFTLRYEQSLAGIFYAKSTGVTDLLSALPVIQGPTSNVTGGSYDFVAGLPWAAARVPTLEFANRPVLWWDNACDDPDPNGPLPGPLGPCPNPRPYGDLRSRGTLTELVFAALTQPGSSRFMGFHSPTSFKKEIIGEM
jgi:hypothetical protein